MADVNDTQVGGDHYQAKYQHWDFIEGNGLGYLEGCATKYVTRYKNKNGLQDLEKAMHYVDKLASLRVKEKRLPRGIATMSKINRFCTANKLDNDQSDFIEYLASWRQLSDLHGARHLLQTMIRKIDGGR